MGNSPDRTELASALSDCSGALAMLPSVSGLVIVSGWVGWWVKIFYAFALLLKPKVRGGGFIEHTRDTRWCMVKCLHAPRSSSKVANAAMVVTAYTSVLPNNRKRVRVMAWHNLVDATPSSALHVLSQKRPQSGDINPAHFFCHPSGVQVIDG